MRLDGKVILVTGAGTGLRPRDRPLVRPGGLVGYGAAKHAGAGITKRAAIDFGREFVRVNPMKRFGEREEVVNLVAFLLSDEPSFINGAVVPIDGGQSRAY